MPATTIIKVRGTLIATMHEDLTDEEALDFQADLNAAIERTGADGLLIDVSQLSTVDSFLGRLLFEIATGAKLLGATTVVAGMQPSVAITLVELGLSLDGIRTVLTTERGLDLLGSRPSGGTLGR